MTASKKVLSADEAAASIEPLLKLASEHFASLALSAAVKLKLPDLIGDGTVTAAELAESLRGRGDADVVNEDAYGPDVAMDVDHEEERPGDARDGPRPR